MKDILLYYNIYWLSWSTIVIHKTSKNCNFVKTLNTHQRQDLASSHLSTESKLDSFWQACSKLKVTRFSCGFSQSQPQLTKAVFFSSSSFYVLLSNFFDFSINTTIALCPSLPFVNFLVFDYHHLVIYICTKGLLFQTIVYRAQGEDQQRRRKSLWNLCS